jgi:hypothetical protein
LAVADLDAEVQRWQSGRSDVPRYAVSSLTWLVGELPHAGKALVSGKREWRGDVTELLEPDQPLLSRLRQLAASWEAQLPGSVTEPPEFMPVSELGYWEQRQKLRDDFLRRAGELILQAVDSVSVKRDLLDDRDFLRCVVRSIDYPAYLPSELLREKTGDALLEFVAQLEPPNPSDRAVLGRDAAETPAGPVVPQNEYPSPNTYARDKWIYENIQEHTCHSLSLALKEKATTEKWQIISSRNGFKKAANRYAVFRGLPERVFRKTTVTE